MPSLTPHIPITLSAQAAIRSMGHNRGDEECTPSSLLEALPAAADLPTKRGTGPVKPPVRERLRGVSGLPPSGRLIGGIGTRPTLGETFFSSHLQHAHCETPVVMSSGPHARAQDSSRFWSPCTLISKCAAVVLCDMQRDYQTLREQEHRARR